MTAEEVMPHEALQDALQALVQTAFLRRPLAALLDACASASLELTVLKGAALSETVYPRPHLRPFGDIDVLVRWEDRLRAHALLLGLGYAVEPNAWKELAAGRVCEANFFQDTERGPVVIELHTDLLNNALLRGSVRVDVPGLWQRSRLACLAGRNARVLGPEDQLLHLCLHLAGHYFDAPKSLQDITQVCAVQPVDWLQFTSICRTARAATIGFCGLFAASVSVGASVPPSVLEALAPARRRRIEVEARVTERVLECGRAQNEAQRFLLLWLVLDSRRARLNAVWFLFFPSPAWLRSRYFYELPDTTAAPRWLLGCRVYGKHLGFLAGIAMRSGRKCLGWARTRGR